VRKELGKLARLAAGAGSSPVLSWRSPERRREVEGEANGRDPPVSGRARRSARSSRWRALAGRLGPDPSRPSVQHSAAFLFLFV